MDQLCRPQYIYSIKYNASYPPFTLLIETFLRLLAALYLPTLSLLVSNCGVGAVDDGRRGDEYLLGVFRTILGIVNIYQPGCM